MASPTSGQKKKAKAGKDQLQTFPPPELDMLTVDESFVLNAALSNDYATICGAFDAKEHPLAAFIAEKGLLNKRNECGKSPFDLAACVGNKDFLKCLLERQGDRLDESVWNLREQLNSARISYNFLHYACIWGYLDIVKLLIEQSKLILDPDLNEADLAAQQSTGQQQGGNKKDQINSAFMRTLSSVLLRSRARTGETPKQLAMRYEHHDIVDYLNFAEKRQSFIDNINETKATANDPEKHQNKLPKDDKKKLDKLCAEALDWLEKNRADDLANLELKIGEIEEQVKPILERLALKISEAAAAATTTTAAVKNSK